MSMATTQGASINFGGDRRPALYGTLVTFLVLNNLAVAARIIAHYRAYYKKGGRIFLEDIFVILSGVCDHVQKRRSQLPAHLTQVVCECCYWEPLGLYVGHHCVQKPCF